ncbi:MAG: hypothetical protein MN733_23910 [Nitrososphaera sp.]|nr:hypothetical protein [Nitrososphaera sp.]
MYKITLVYLVVFLAGCGTMHTRVNEDLPDGKTTHVSIMDQQYNFLGSNTATGTSYKCSTDAKGQKKCRRMDAVGHSDNNQLGPATVKAIGEIGASVGFGVSLDPPETNISEETTLKGGNNEVMAKGGKGVGGAGGAGGAGGSASSNSNSNSSSSSAASQKQEQEQKQAQQQQQQQQQQQRQSNQQQRPGHKKPKKGGGAGNQLQNQTQILLQ